jgi:hypothetical protein
MLGSMEIPRPFKEEEPETESMESETEFLPNFLPPKSKNSARALGKSRTRELGYYLDRGGGRYRWFSPVITGDTYVRT